MGDETAAQHREAEDILAQYLWAAGAGGGLIWVKRHAVRALREHYLPAIKRALRKHHEWRRAAPYILSFLQTIGQVAKARALDQGRHVVERDDMVHAIKAVEENYNVTDDAGGEDVGTSFGVWCPDQ